MRFICFILIIYIQYIFNAKAEYIPYIESALTPWMQQIGYEFSKTLYSKLPMDSFRLAINLTYSDHGKDVLHINEMQCADNFYYWNKNAEKFYFTDEKIEFHENGNDQHIPIMHVHFNLNRCFTYNFNTYFHQCLYQLFEYLALIGKKTSICYLADTNQRIVKLDDHFNNDYLQEFPLFMYYITSMLNEFCIKLYMNSTISLIEEYPSCLVHFDTRLGNYGIQHLSLRTKMKQNERIDMRLRTLHMLRDGLIKQSHMPKNIFNETNHDGLNILIYSREDARNKRKILNPVEIQLNLQQKFPYYHVRLIRHLPVTHFAEIIKIFSSTNILIAPHGGWGPNLMFMPKGSLAFIINTKNSYHWDAPFQTKELHIIDVISMEKPKNWKKDEESYELKYHHQLHCPIVLDDHIDVLHSNLNLTDISCIINYISQYQLQLMKNSIIL